MNKLTQEETQILVDLLDSRDNARRIHFKALRNPSKDDQIKNVVERGELLRIGLKLLGYYDKDNSTKRV
jgi:hypothetical protein